MDGAPPPGPLESDPRNPCVGCGPENRRGLRLAFSSTGDGATAALVAAPDLAGFPDRLHSGVLYLALIETANWTTYAATGRGGVPTRTSALALKRFVPTGTTLTLRGRVVSRNGTSISVATEAVDGTGVVATLDRDLELATRAEVQRRLGYDKLPAVLEEVFPE